MREEKDFNLNFDDGLVLHELFIFRFLEDDPRVRRDDNRTLREI
jgi:hypothetical protein